jgi:hypothetical protein
MRCKNHVYQDRLNAHRILLLWRLSIRVDPGAEQYRGMSECGILPNEDLSSLYRASDGSGQEGRPRSAWVRPAYEEREASTRAQVRACTGTSQWAGVHAGHAPGTPPGAGAAPLHISAQDGARAVPPESVSPPRGAPESSVDAAARWAMQAAAADDAGRGDGAHPAAALGAGGQEPAVARQVFTARSQAAGRVLPWPGPGASREIRVAAFDAAAYAAARLETEPPALRGEPETRLRRDGNATAEPDTRPSIVAAVAAAASPGSPGTYAGTGRPGLLQDSLQPHPNLRETPPAAAVAAAPWSVLLSLRACLHDFLSESQRQLAQGMDAVCLQQLAEILRAWAAMLAQGIAACQAHGLAQAAAAGESRAGATRMQAEALLLSQELDAKKREFADLLSVLQEAESALHVQMLEASTPTAGVAHESATGAGETKRTRFAMWEEGVEDGTEQRPRERESAQAGGSPHASGEKRVAREADTGPAPRAAGCLTGGEAGPPARVVDAAATRGGRDGGGGREDRGGPAAQKPATRTQRLGQANRTEPAHAVAGSVSLFEEGRRTAAAAGRGGAGEARVRAAARGDAQHAREAGARGAAADVPRDAPRDAPHATAERAGASPVRDSGAEARAARSGPGDGPVGGGPGDGPGAAVGAEPAPVPRGGRDGTAASAGMQGSKGAAASGAASGAAEPRPPRGEGAGPAVPHRVPPELARSRYADAGPTPAHRDADGEAPRGSPGPGPGVRGPQWRGLPGAWAGGGGGGCEDAAEGVESVPLRPSSRFGKFENFAALMATLQRKTEDEDEDGRYF